MWHATASAHHTLVSVDACIVFVFGRSGIKGNAPGQLMSGLAGSRKIGARGVPVAPLNPAHEGVARRRRMMLWYRSTPWCNGCAGGPLL